MLRERNPANARKHAAENHKQNPLNAHLAAAVIENEANTKATPSLFKPR